MALPARSESTMTELSANLSDLLASHANIIDQVIGKTDRFSFQASRHDHRVLIPVSKLGQILTHLFMAADNFAPDGHVITIASGDLHISPAPSVTKNAAAYLSCLISFEGLNVSTEIWNAGLYCRLPNGELPSNTSLDLASAADLLHEFGGQLSLAKNSGDKGSEIRIQLPAVIAQAGPAIAEEQGPKVLIVEDEPMIREVINKVLKRRGYQVREANDSSSALKALQEEDGEIELIIADVVLPDRHGGALAIDARRRFGDIPILFFSGYPREALIHQRLVAKDDHFIQKPFSAGVLIDQVKEILQDHKVSNPTVDAPKKDPSH